VGNEHDTSGLLQRCVYRIKKTKTQTTNGNQTSKEQEDIDKEYNNANQNNQCKK
jgi:hypothetical protein